MSEHFPGGVSFRDELILSTEEKKERDMTEFYSEPLNPVMIGRVWTQNEEAESGLRLPYFTRIHF